MPQPPESLEHQDVEKKTDEALRQEARAHLSDSPPLQLLAELHARLRSAAPAWWTPEALRGRWSATERMRWYRARPDLRQRITTQLTGLAPRSARKKAPEFQGALIDSAIDEGDVSARAFEDAFDPADLAVYGPGEDLWKAFVERMPWGDDAPLHQELSAWLFDALLADRSSIDGLYRKPILTAWDARTAIDGRVWHTRMPLEIRVAIDEARFEKERQRPGEPFHAESDLSIAVSATIAASIPLRDLAPVFDAAGRRMGFSPRAVTTGEAQRPPGPAARPSVAPAPPSIAPPPASIAPPPAATAPGRSVPPPAPSRSPQPAPSASSGPRRAGPEPARGSAPQAAQSPPTPARPPSATLPDALHHIPGEEERTNPWDIPTDENLPPAGESSARPPVKG